MSAVPATKVVSREEAARHNAELIALVSRLRAAMPSMLLTPATAVTDITVMLRSAGIMQRHVVDEA